MKFSELMTLTEKMASAVSEAVSGVEAKFASRLDVLSKSLESYSSGAAVRDQEFKSVVDGYEAKIAELRGDIAEIGRTERVGVKSVIGEGKTILVGLTDGTVETIELDIPEPIPGERGATGLDGLSGKDGVSGVDGKNGEDGTSGVDGKNGADGKDGANGKDGVDGVGVKSFSNQDGYIVVELSSGDEYRVEMPKPEAPAMPALPREPIDVRDAMIDRNGELTIVFSNGSTKNVGLIVGRDGIHGIDGRDGVDGERGSAGADGINGRDGLDGLPGLGFDDMSAEISDDGRTVVFKFVRGDMAKEFPMKFPAMIYRGAYDGSKTYETGDVVSYGGATFHANGETIGAVPGVAEIWTQQTAAGRSVRGQRGLSGADGRDGTNGKDLRAFS